jgi:protein subunit release factor A
MDGYPTTIEKQMVHFFQSLSEKDRRRYAAVEAAKLGHGGTAYIARLFGCKVDTVERGKEDVQRLPKDEAAGRVRKKGGSKTS